MHYRALARPTAALRTRRAPTHQRLDGVRPRTEGPVIVCPGDGLVILRCEPASHRVNQVPGVVVHAQMDINGEGNIVRARSLGDCEAPLEATGQQR